MPEETTTKAIGKPPTTSGSRAVLRMCSNNENDAAPTPSIQHNEQARISGTPAEAETPFQAQHLFLHGPHGGDWIVHEVFVDGVSQTIEPFPTSDLVPGGRMLDIAPCKLSIEFVVIYVGQRPEGAHFYGSVVGRGPLK